MSRKNHKKLLCILNPKYEIERKSIPGTKIFAASLKEPISVMSFACFLQVRMEAPKTVVHKK